VGEGKLGAVTPEAAAETTPPPRWSGPVRVAALALAVAVVAAVLWGGYGHRWPWTGINGRTATLWDWLHLLMLPVAFAMLPLLLSERTRMRREHRWAGALLLLAFAAFVIAGYGVPWGWTGFSGNRLWDWLELLALPLAVALVPLMDDIRRSWTPRHSFVAAVGLAAFVAIVIGGYVGHWRWTGFRGNTLWDWLHLLLLPLLLPTVIVPRLLPRIEAAMIVVEEPAETPHGAKPVAIPPAIEQPAAVPAPTAEQPPQR
jgi:uncharacterized membrane protein